MRKYEIVFIFLPNQEEEERNQLLERFKGIVEENGTVEKVDEWGLRKLAYPIKAVSKGRLTIFNEGYYVLLNIETTPDTVNELDRIIKISDSIMRHIIVREDE